MGADIYPAVMDIPVYRISEESYYYDMDSYISRTVGRVPMTAEEAISKRNDPYYIQNVVQESQLRLSYGGPWKYNEIIGFIRIGFVRSRIRGEYWAVHAKRIVRTRRKLFKRKVGCLAEDIAVLGKLDSKEIYQSVIAYIEYCRAELPKFYIDSAQLEAIGPYVDWKSLMLAHNCSPQARKSQSEIKR